VYIGLGNDLFFIKIDVEHDLFISGVAIVVLTVIEGCEDGVILFGVFDEVVLLLILVSAIEDHVVLALQSVFVPLHIANQHKLGILRGIDVVPLLRQQRL
jgi:hypothetical protein